MAMFSRFKRPDSVAQSDFPKEIPQYEIETSIENKQIVKRLVEAEEKINIYDMIQADNHGLDVYELLDRFAKGDTSIKLGVIDWQDGDFTGSTMSLVEMQAFMDTKQAEFESSPLELRQHYDNDFTKYLYGLESGEFKTWLDSKTKDTEQPVKEEKTNE